MSTAALMPTRKQVFALAIPVIFANLATPLLGMVDTAVMGRYPDAVHIAAIGLGATVFSLLFWGFSFLRLATVGLTAQASGAQDEVALYAHLFKPLLLAAGIGVVLLLLQQPMAFLLFGLLGGEAEVQELGKAYYYVRIWAAPFTLANFALSAWFLGQSKAGRVLALQLIMNGTNIALTLFFVLHLKWGIRGAALGTVLAEITVFAVAAVWAWRGWVAAYWEQVKPALQDKAKWALLWRANGNIMVRTLLLVGGNALLINRSAALGTEVLAANQMLMQLVLLGSYFLDGFANVGEVYGGRAVGRADSKALQRIALRTGGYAVAAAVGVSATLWFTGDFWLQVFTVNEALQELTRSYIGWVALLPLVAVFAFHLDGLYLGATATRAMRNGMLWSFAVFVLTIALFVPLWGNHGLWLAYWFFMAWRGFTLLWQWPSLLRYVAQPSNRI
ncbi:MAG TPA: MATE family efflux transporter [Alcanivoracaceae bacterium]|nr:MATE family efflux transporter [Alcanivoracaceae bacterium]